MPSRMDREARNNGTRKIVLIMILLEKWMKSRNSRTKASYWFKGTAKHIIKQKLNICQQYEASSKGSKTFPIEYHVMETISLCIYNNRSTYHIRTEIFDITKEKAASNLPGVPTPIVSPREISEQPMSYNCLDTYATFVGATIPSTGQPTTHDMYLQKRRKKVSILSYH